MVIPIPSLNLHLLALTRFRLRHSPATVAASLPQSRSSLTLPTWKSQPRTASSNNLFRKHISPSLSFDKTKLLTGTFVPKKKWNGVKESYPREGNSQKQTKRGRLSCRISPPFPRSVLPQLGHKRNKRGPTCKNRPQSAVDPILRIRWGSATAMVPPRRQHRPPALLTDSSLGGAPAPSAPARPSLHSPV